MVQLGGGKERDTGSKMGPILFTAAVSDTTCFLFLSFDSKLGD